MVSVSTAHDYVERQLSSQIFRHLLSKEDNKPHEGSGLA